MHFCCSIVISCGWYSYRREFEIAINIAIDRYVNKPQAQLIAELKAGNLCLLSDEQQAQFVPMAFRFFEAARQGEYAHNLEMLAAYITGELKKEVPDAGSVSEMAHRIQGLPKDSLALIAIINSLIMTKQTKNEVIGNNITFEVNDIIERTSSALHDDVLYAQCIEDIANRGFLRTFTMPLLGGSKQIYSPTSAFYRLIENMAYPFNSGASIYGVKAEVACLFARFDGAYDPGDDLIYRRFV